MTPLAPTTGSQKVTFQYDYLGRRVEKEVYNWGGSEWETSPWYVIRYVYDGWRMLLEMDGSGTILKKYTWGLDLAGLNGQVNSLEGAGTISGLLAVQVVGGAVGGGDLNYAYLYDANGNVGQLVDWAHDADHPEDALVAKYEYDPYGGVTAVTGSYAADNVWRFSTKQFDAETGLGYWGYRYYSPTLGRWVSRDPAQERGGPNLYTCARNDPVSLVDLLGMHPIVAVLKCLPCLESARQLAEQDAQWYLDNYKDPHDNGYKAWHCVTACHAYRQCSEDLPPALKQALAAGITAAGFLYEGLTLAGTGQGDSFDGQNCWSWLFDTPGDIIANELGLLLGAFSEKSCREACKAAFLIPGPKDPDNANVPWRPKAQTTN